MRKFRKMVAIEPTKLLPEWDTVLKGYAEESIFHTDIPQSNPDIIQRIGDADCVILSYTSRIEREVLQACPRIQYIGMCCSLYSPESANVDVLYAREQGIVVTGARDYGDEGVKEYVVSELVRLLQGRGDAMWRNEPMELTDLNIGIVGMGTLGGIVARTLVFFGCNIYYYSRTRRLQLEDLYDYTYMPLDEMLGKVDILITCLNKNVVLFGQREFDLFGSGKIFMNVSISPSHEISALKDWLRNDSNYAFSDSVAGLGEELVGLKNAYCGTRNAGLTSLAKQRLGKIVANNIELFLTDSSHA